MGNPYRTIWREGHHADAEAQHNVPRTLAAKNLPTQRLVVILALARKVGNP